MKVSINLVEMKEQDVLSIRETIKGGELFDKIFNYFRIVQDYCDKQGIEISGPPFCRYLKSGGGIMDVECGFPVDSPQEGSGRISSGKIPGGKVATAVHVGSYETIIRTYEYIRRWIDKRGYKTAGPI